MGLTLKEMQELAEQQYSIEDTRRDLEGIVRFFQAQETHKGDMNALSNFRELPIDIINESNVFFVQQDRTIAEIPIEYTHESLGLVRYNYITMAGRMVYPVYDVRKQVMGFCAWDGWETPKYLDSRNSGYLAKATTLYGMEKLEEYYRSDKPVYVVEGIVCCLYLRSIGLQALALLGSSMTYYVIEILKRFGSRLIIVPDNDIIGKPKEAVTKDVSGEHLVRFSKRKLPKALVVQSKVAKDVDDTRKEGEHKYEKEFIKDITNVGINRFTPLSTLILR